MPPPRNPARACGKCGAKLFQGRPVELAEAGFERHLRAGDLPLLVDFWAAWCGPCRMMAPVLEATAQKLEPRLRVAKLDTEAFPALAARHGIQSLPTLVLFQGGREVARVAGAMPQSQLEAWIERQLGA
jgi:thioredoxin 2